MASAFNAAMVFIAQAEPGGRGGNPDESVGLVTIIVIAVLVLAGGLVLGFFFSRGRARRRSQQRRPDTAGRVGRVSKMRGD
jgi:flagellar basal body-associated protein FliL